MRSERLTLEPLRVSHADDMVEVLADLALYEFIGGEPPTFDELRERYERQVAGPAAASERWLNWIVRTSDGGVAVGFVQATLIDVAGSWSGQLAWLVGRDHQRRGYATEAARAAMEWLLRSGVTGFEAHIAPTNVASTATASTLGFSWSGAVDVDGEQVWLRSAP